MQTKTSIGNVTLVIDGELNRATRLLLGLKAAKKKKAGRKVVGSGKWMPPGGAFEPADKSQKHAAQRELFEETGLILPLSSFRKVGVLRGYFGHSDIPRWYVHIYLAQADSRKPLKTNGELEKPQWFPVTHLPFSNMLAGDVKWIPRILRGQKLLIKICFDESGQKLKKNEIREVRLFNRSET